MAEQTQLKSHSDSPGVAGEETQGELLSLRGGPSVGELQCPHERLTVEGVTTTHPRGGVIKR